MLCNYIQSFQDPPYYDCNNGKAFTCKMYGYLLIGVLCESLRKLLFCRLCFVLQRKGTETQGKRKKKLCPLRPLCLDYRIFQVTAPFIAVNRLQVLIYRAP